MDQDWAAYKAAYAQRLLPFLDKKRLRTACNLLALKNDGIVHLRHQGVADRLFASERPKPNRLFTGIGFDYWQLLELACARPGLTILNLRNKKRFIMPPFDACIPPGNYVISGDGISFSYLDILDIFDNLIGDQLCDFILGAAAEEFVGKLYNTSPGEDQLIQNNLAVFQDLIKSSKQGWIEIIPYNDNFAFLHDGAGRCGLPFLFIYCNDLAAQ